MEPFLKACSSGSSNPFRRERRRRNHTWRIHRRNNRRNSSRPHRNSIHRDWNFRSFGTAAALGSTWTGACTGAGGGDPCANGIETGRTAIGILETNAGLTYRVVAAEDTEVRSHTTIVASPSRVRSHRGTWCNFSFTRRRFHLHRRNRVRNPVDRSMIRNRICRSRRRRSAVPPHGQTEERAILPMHPHTTNRTVVSQQRGLPRRYSHTSREEHTTPVEAGRTTGLVGWTRTHSPQSCGQVSQVSPSPQIVSPQMMRGPQSCGQVAQVSPNSQTVSPQTVSDGFSLP